MTDFKIIAVCLCLVAVLAIAGVAPDDDEYSDKQWVNALLLQGNAGKIVEALMELPSEPVRLSESGEVIIPRAYFYKILDERGNPNLAVLFQISDSSKVKADVIFNANKKAGK